MRQTVTILFSDIRNSSKLWTSHPKRMSKALDRLLIAMQKISQRFQGMIVKTIGDAFMLAFRGPEHLQRALLAAYEIQQLVLPVRAPEAMIKQRIGISSGEVDVKKATVQGCVIEDVFGTVVNAASRMESKISPVGGFAVAVFRKRDLLIAEASMPPAGAVREFELKKHCPSWTMKRSKRLVSSCDTFQSDPLKGVRKDMTVLVWTPKA